MNYSITALRIRPIHLGKVSTYNVLTMEFKLYRAKIVNIISASPALLPPIISQPLCLYCTFAYSLYSRSAS